MCHTQSWGCSKTGNQDSPWLIPVSEMKVKYPWDQPKCPAHECFDNLHAQSRASSTGEVINLLHRGPFQQEPYVFLYLEI